MTVCIHCVSYNPDCVDTVYIVYQYVSVQGVFGDLIKTTGIESQGKFGQAKASLPFQPTLARPKAPGIGLTSWLGHRSVVGAVGLCRVVVGPARSPLHAMMA